MHLSACTPVNSGLNFTPALPCSADRSPSAVVGFLTLACLKLGAEILLVRARSLLHFMLMEADFVGDKKVAAINHSCRAGRVH